MAVRVDWVAYYKQFAVAHGGNPVVMRKAPGSRTAGGMLLFPDGWRYGPEPHGPEMPPENETKQLQLIRMYWNIRRRVIQYELRQAREEIERLVDMQQKCSVTLMVPEEVIIEDEQGGRRRVVESRPVDFPAMIKRVRELAAELAECKRMLESPVIPEQVPVEFSAAVVLTELEDIEIP